MESIEQIYELNTLEKTKKEIEKLQEKIESRLISFSALRNSDSYDSDDDNSESEDDNYLKKDLEIKKLEKNKYYNKNLESSISTDELENIIKEHSNQIQFQNFILKLIELKNIRYFDNITEKNIMSITQIVDLANILVELEKISIIIDDKYTELSRDLAKISFNEKYLPIKDFYSNILILNLTNHLNNFHRLKNIVNKKITSLQNNNFSFYMKIAIGVVLVSALANKQN